MPLARLPSANVRSGTTRSHSAAGREWDFSRIPDTPKLSIQPNAQATMKFNDLRPGELFEYAGKRYRKSGPLTASPIDGGGSAMIARSASVTLLSDREQTVTARPTQVSAEDAARAIEALYLLARQALDRLEDEAGTAELDTTRRNWLTRLGLDS
jgi:hypothetical protein